MPDDMMCCYGLQSKRLWLSVQTETFKGYPQVHNTHVLVKISFLQYEFKITELKFKHLKWS